MEWLKPVSGQTRIVTRFALLPIEANGTICWLRTVKIHQSYGTSKSGWCNDWFVESE